MKLSEDFDTLWTLKHIGEELDAKLKGHLFAMDVRLESEVVAKHRPKPDYSDRQREQNLLAGEKQHRGSLLASQNLNSLYANTHQSRVQNVTYFSPLRGSVFGFL